MGSRRSIVIGGLGGGGDVVLALMLAYHLGLDPGDLVVVSFNRCKVRRDRLEDLRVHGSLIRVPPGYFPSRRVFEDKLHLVEPALSGNVYVSCTRDPFQDVVEGLAWVIQRFRPRAMIHADLGGDGIVLGYEESLGSYKTDTVARAALAVVSTRYNVRSYLAEACVGCEGGGGELDHRELAGNLEYAARIGALVKTIVLPRELARVGYEILRYADSGMLPLFLAAVTGKKSVEIRRAYLNGVYTVMPWYHCVFIIDNERYCQESTLCRELVTRGRLGRPGTGRKPKGLKRAEPASTLQRLCRQYRDKPLPV